VNHYDFSNRPSIKRKANRNEKRVAKLCSAIQTPCSGAIAGHKGDFKTKDFLYDLKSTDACSIKIDVAMLRKLLNEANGAGKEPVIVLRFNEVKNIEKEYAVIPLNLFEEMKEHYDN